MAFQEHIGPEEKVERRRQLLEASEATPVQLEAELLRKHAGILEDAMRTNGISLAKLEENQARLDVLFEQERLGEQGLTPEDARKALDYLLERAKTERMGKLEKMFRGKGVEVEDDLDGDDVARAA
jgi:hypothetical protein